MLFPETRSQLLRNHFYAEALVLIGAYMLGRGILGGAIATMAGLLFSIIIGNFIVINTPDPGEYNGKN